MLAVLLGFDFLQAVEVPEQGAPLGLQSRRGETVFQRLAQDERKERAKYMAADCGVRLMIDRPGVENGFCRSEDVLHLEQLAISQHGGERAQGGVGAQDIEAVISSKALVGNGGYRRFLAATGENGFVIDRAKAEEDVRFDGIFVLRTNTGLAPLDVMLCYEQLTMVEQIFRTAKSLFATRPIFHKLDETIRGHVSCSFLALVLKKALEDRIADLGKPGSWPEIPADLDSLTETEVEQDNKRFLLRSAPCPAASLALRAVGVALPLTVRQVAEARSEFYKSAKM